MRKSEVRDKFPTTLNLTINRPLLADRANARGRKKKIIASTMDESDLKSLYTTLADHFKELSEQERSREGGSLLMEDDLRGVFGQDGHDMGVTAYKEKTYEELSMLLGFPEGRPPLFSKYRSKDTTINSWDDPEEESPKWSQGGEGLSSLTLKWHQLCGVASMVEKTFVQQKGGGTNICLADDVGLGKSAQIMAFIAFLITVWYSEQDPDRPRPPIVGAFFFTMLWHSQKVVPDCLHCCLRRQNQSFLIALRECHYPTSCLHELISLS